MKLFRYLKKGFYSLNEYWKSAAVLSSKYRERTRLYFFMDMPNVRIWYAILA